MQQIQNLEQNKEAPEMERFSICNNDLVRQVDYRWNQVYSSLMLMYEKLERFGLMSYISEGDGRL
jgi:hypothetical protein